MGNAVRLRRIEIMQSGDAVVRTQEATYGAGPDGQWDSTPPAADVRTEVVSALRPLAEACGMTLRKAPKPKKKPAPEPAPDPEQADDAEHEDK